MLIILSLLPMSLISIEKEIPNENNLQLNLEYYNLPDNYDKAIEDYFLYFEYFLKIQDKNSSYNENSKIVIDFFENLDKSTLSEYTDRLEHTFRFNRAYAPNLLSQASVKRAT